MVITAASLDTPSIPPPPLPKAAGSRLYQLLDAVAADATMHLDVFAPDLETPELRKAILRLARAGAVRIVLDGDDEFENEFRESARGGSAIRNGRFERHTLEKVFIVSRNGAPVRVLTGSCRFVESDDPVVASAYARFFLAAWHRKGDLSKTLQ